MPHDIQLVRAKENLKLSWVGPDSDKHQAPTKRNKALHQSRHWV